MIDDKTTLQDQSQLKGWLVLLTGEWAGKDFPLYEGKNRIGSSHYADIYLPEPTVDPFHFSIRFLEKPAPGMITDLDSESGLYIGGKRIYREPIADEMTVGIGCGENEILCLLKLLNG